MVYQIKKTNGAILTSINDYNEDDSSSSITLFGRGLQNYGYELDTNLIHMLENFSNIAPPSNPIEGQLWYQNYTSDRNNNSINQKKLFFYNGTQWVRLLVASTTQPTNPENGDLWVDTSTNTLYYYSNGWYPSSNFYTSQIPPSNPTNGMPWLMMPERLLWIYDTTLTAPSPSFTRLGGPNSGSALTGSWLLVGDQYPQESNTRSYYASVPDINNNYHTVKVNLVGGRTNSIECTSYFVMDLTKPGAITDFVSLNEDLSTTTNQSKIYPGITLNNSLDTTQTYFGGIALSALSAKSVLGYDLSDLLGRGGNQNVSPTTPISNGNIDLGSSSLRWNTVYANNIDALNSIKLNGNDIATQQWVLGQNYSTMDSLKDFATRDWVLGQNYATQGWVLGQNYSTVRNLSDLLDTSVSSPSNNQYLIYDGGTNKWQNKPLQIDPDTNNLAKLTSNGLLVTLASAKSNIYVSKTLGSDTTGDGSQSNPYATIRKAINEVADSTPCNIYLRSGDTFNVEDGASDYVEGGTVNQIVNGSISIGNRKLSFYPYANSIWEEAVSTSGVSEADVEIGTQPSIVFTTSKSSDTGDWISTGFFITSDTIFEQISFISSTKNISSLTSTTNIGWAGGFSPSSGRLFLSACNFSLSWATLMSGPGGNTSNSTINLYRPRFDTTNGSAFINAEMGVTLRAPSSDETTSQSRTVNGFTFNTRIHNFNSSCGHLASYYNINVINSSARIYGNISTMNKLDS